MADIKAEDEVAQHRDDGHEESVDDEVRDGFFRSRAYSFQHAALGWAWMHTSVQENRERKIGR